MTQDLQAFRASPEQLAAAARCAAQPGAEHPYWSVLELALSAPLSRAELESRLRSLVQREELLRTRLQPLPGLSEPAQLIAELVAQPLLSEPRVMSDFELWRDASPALELQLMASCAPDLDGGGARLQLRAPSTHLDLPSLWQIARVLLGEVVEQASVQHADYAEWKHAVVAESGAGVEHFRGVALRASSPRLGLTHAAAGELFEPQSYELTLSEAIWKRLHTLVDSGTTSLPALLAAAYVGLLQRHSQNAEVSLSWQDAQLSAALEHAVGPYAQPLPLNVPVTAGEPLTTLARQLERAAAEAAAFRDAHMPGRDSDFAFAYHAHSLPVGTTLARAYSVTERWKLRLRVLHSDARPRLFLDFDPGVLSRAALPLLAEQYSLLIGSLCAAAPLALEAVPLCGQLQSAVLTRESGPEPNAAESHVQRVQLHARLQPDARAVVDARGALTYAELEEQSNRLARMLAARGVGAGDVVGLMLTRTRLMPVAILATHKLGAAYLPLDPVYPAERLDFMLGDSGARCVVSEPELAGLCERLSAGQVLLVDAELLRSASESVQALPLPASDASTQLAYLIYTSGSTGQPKAVEITQHSLALSTEARRSSYGTPVGAFLLLSSFSFDSSVAGIFWTLADGGCLVIADEAEMRDPTAIARLCRLHAVTHGLSLPSVYSALLALPELTRQRALQTWIVAGESCSLSLVQAHHARLPSVTLYNEYGPTEGTVWASVEPLTAAVATQAEVSIGRAIPGMRLWLVSEAGPVCGLGEPGEIVLGGPLLARGYRGQPEQTAERFVVHAAAGERVYRTADRARWGRDGRLYYLGRSDRQVKVRGQRVELAEIERQLLTHPAVAEAVVLANVDELGTRLYAYVQSSPAGPALDAELLAQLSARLPVHMLPSALRSVAQLARTPNGKIDVAALPAPLAQVATTAYEEPQTERERELASLIKELLRVQRVGATDDFFALGGDSITSLQLCARAAQRGVGLRVRDIFEHKTVRGLAAVAVACDGADATQLPQVHHARVSADVAQVRETCELSSEELACLLVAGALSAAHVDVIVLETQLIGRDGVTQSYQRRVRLPRGEMDCSHQLRALRRELHELGLESGADVLPAALGLRVLELDEDAREPARPASAQGWLSLVLGATQVELHAWGEPAREHGQRVAARLAAVLSELASQLAAQRGSDLLADAFPSSGLDADGLAQLLDSFDA